jgi:protein ImuB
MPGQSANAALALLATLRLEERSRVREQQVLEALATWLERFSSFVSIAGKNVLLLEIAGSLRLFGGLKNLRQTISKGLDEKGFSAAMAIAPTPLAATWLARTGRRTCIRAEENLGPALRKLPLTCLDWPAGQRESLTGMGISTVGDCLRLPREGFARRFGVERLLDLDRALGHLPDPRDSWRAPERFSADYEMAEEQSDRDLLLQICRELLLSHEQFLLARQLGTQRLCFSFFHLKNVVTELQLGSAFADRSAERWFDLLNIRFESVRLPEAVIAVRLRSGLSQSLQAETARLCFDNRAGSLRHRFSIAQLAERLVARIGDHSVNALAMVAEHRPEYAFCVQNPLADWSASTLTAGDGSKRPLWMLPKPALLPADGAYPLHKGCRLTLLDGPERLETGWWDEQGISRDYYTAVNGEGMRLWIFRNRQRTPNWYLHGLFG